MNKKNKRKVNYRRTFFPKIPTYNNIMYYNSLVKLLLAIILAILIFICFHFVTFNHHKTKIKTVTKYKDKIAENIVFLGDSITEIYDLDKYYPDHNVVNSCISGNTTEDSLDNMYERVYRYNPSKVFLLIGTNQIVKDDSSKIESDIAEIVDNIHENVPLAKVYVESIYPINKDVSNIPGERDNGKIIETNKLIKNNAKKHKYKYINVHVELLDKEGRLKEEYTYDGLHTIENGFDKVTEILKKYI